MNNVSFTATIKPVTYDQMAKIKWDIDKKNEPLNYPFRNDNTRLYDHYAEGNWDCTYISLNNGKIASGTQISPTDPCNYDMQELGEEFVSNAGGFLTNPKTHAVLIGSSTDKVKNPYSTDYFQFYRDLMDVYSKDMTILRGNKDYEGTDIAYDNDKDTYYLANRISNEMLNKGAKPRNVLNAMYDEVVISSKDRVE